MVKYALEAVSVGLAIAAATLCSIRYSRACADSTRFNLIGAVIASIIFAIAHTTLWETVPGSSTLGFNENLWAAFDFLVMIIFLNMGLTKDPK